jgi:hypothetical protein
MSRIILMVLLLMGCGAPQPKPVEPNDTDQCKPACVRMADLGCPEGEPLGNGMSCQQFCEDTQSRGHALNPTCLAKISSCGEIDACSVNRQGW